MFHVFRLTYTRSDQPGKKHDLGYFRTRQLAEARRASFFVGLLRHGGAEFHRVNCDLVRATNRDEPEKRLEVRIHAIEVLEA